MERVEMELHKGDIHLVNFNPAKGGEIGKLRPAIIMSSDEDSAILQTAIVIPLSTVIEADAQPYRYFISSREELHKDSDACIYEIRSLSKTRIKQRVAKLTSEELQIITENLCKIIN